MTTNAVRPWPIFQVEVYPFEPFLYTAPTRDKARWRAWEAFSGVYHSETFAGWLARGVTVRRLEKPPAEDGYDYVRAYYGVSPRIGERMRLVNEGSSSGREVTVVYPGKSTASIHCVYDGQDRAMLVHPSDVERIA